MLCKFSPNLHPTLFPPENVWHNKRSVMKRGLLLLTTILILTVLQSCCKHDDDFGYCSTPAVITGIDYRECICCGGWFIDIGGEELRAPTLPTDFMESFSPDDLPLPVFLEWERVEEPCLGDEIEVSCIRRR